MEFLQSRNFKKEIVVVEKKVKLGVVAGVSSDRYWLGEQWSYILTRKYNEE